MNLNKALSFLAYGFLLILININITVGELTVNLTPSFVGWFLMFLAYEPLGNYTRGNTLRKWVPLALAVIGAVMTVLTFFARQLTIDAPALPAVISGLCSLASVVYMYLLFGTLEDVASDCHPALFGRIRILKYLTIALELAGLAATLYVYYMGASLPVTSYAMVAGVLGLVMLAVAVVTAVTLFQLRKKAMSASFQKW